MNRTTSKKAKVYPSEAIAKIRIVKYIFCRGRVEVEDFFFPFCIERVEIEKYF